MGVTLRMDGLSEFREALRNLPAELAEESGQIVAAHAEMAKSEIVQGYHRGPTGNLKGRVTLSRQASKVSTRAIVSSRAPHAWMYEHGTATRHTSRGENRGRMPRADAASAMLPKVIRIRARMIEALKDVVRRAGLEVA